MSANKRSKSDKAGLWEHAWRVIAPEIAPELYDSVSWTPEYGFAAEVGRRHRFDYASIPYRIAIEVDGGVWTPHGGRHARDTDREKLNIAASLGWFVFRFSTQMLERNPTQCVSVVCDGLRRVSRCDTL